jgi:hypothetical protein
MTSVDLRKMSVGGRAMVTEKEKEGLSEIQSVT